VIGLVIVFASVLGGFAMVGGPFPVLIQPSELVVIAGAALGALVVSAPGAVRTRVFTAFKHSFKPDLPTKQDYIEILTILSQLFQLMRRDGALALESHVSDPAKSSIFSKYPNFMRRHHARDFLVDGLRQLVDGCSVNDLSLLLDADLETMQEEEHRLIRATGDALPGLGIVAAVLGIIVTMAHLDGGPEEIGHHVAAALVGTFLGILLCYGVVGPLATSLEMQAQCQTRYMLAIKDGLLSAARGSPPAISVEFARRAIFTDERPSNEETAKAIASGKEAK
jgi:chemotaxis protein MotA